MASARKTFFRRHWLWLTPLCVVVVAGAAPAILWDWNWFKAPLAARLSLAADRSVTIDGPLAVRLGRVTHVRLQGLISDRDIVTRAVAEGYDPDECYVREIMSPDVMWC